MEHPITADRLFKIASETTTEDTVSWDRQAVILDLAIGYLDTELELLNRYRKIFDRASAAPLRWTSNRIDLIELIYRLQELHCIDDGEIAINELFAFFGSLFGLELKDSLCYNTYSDMKHRKSESRTYFPDKMCKHLNLRMQQDDDREWERRR